MMKNIIIVVLIWNMITFYYYWYDKQLAYQKRRRVPERVLILMSFFGGGVGAILSAYIFHHKIRKWYFKLVWLLSLILVLISLIVVWRVQ